MQSLTHFDSKKLRTIAALAKLCVEHTKKLPDDLTIKQVLTEAIRKLHDHAQSHRGKGKYEGHAHWSRKALQLLTDSGNRLTDIKGKLAHEHVVPVNIVVGKLLALPLTSSIDVFEKIITDFSVVAILTKEEDALLRAAKLHKSMPSNWDHQDPWIRYRNVGLYAEIVPSLDQPD
jgi:hypothetical protein